MTLPDAPRITPVISDIDARRARLRRAKAGAAALLVAALLVLIAARLYPEPSFVAALARAAAEAAIVGGLADWFAVTALFRRPLGLPIPHTALIPARKDEIGRSLGHFVSEQFLAPELLLARLRQKNRALQVAQWLERPAIAAFIGARIAGLVPAAVGGANDADLRRFFAKVAQEGLQRIDLRPTLNTIVDALLRQGRHMTVADAVIELLDPIIAGLREPLIARIGARTGRLFPRYFDRKIGAELVQGFSNWLQDAKQPGSDERKHLEAWLLTWIAEMRAAPDYAALIGRAQAALVNHPALAQSLGAIWDELKAELLTDAARPTPKLASLAEQLVRTVGRLLADSPAVQQHFNAALETALIGAITPWRASIGGYIADIVASWDGHKVAEVIELQVGRDLQYIRVNGTIVGALIGSALFLIGSALPLLRHALLK